MGMMEPWGRGQSQLSEKQGRWCCKGMFRQGNRKLERTMFCSSDSEMRQEINGKGEACGKGSPDEQKLRIQKSDQQHILPVVRWSSHSYAHFQFIYIFLGFIFIVYSRFFSTIGKMSRNCLNLKEMSFISFRDKSFCVQEEKTKLPKVVLEPC